MTWNTPTNWSGADVPDTATEDVVMVSTGFNANFATNYSLGCLSVLSGTINGTTANTDMTITGDYFSAPYQNSLNFTSASFRVIMGGSSPQTFEAVDDIRDLRITNTSTVTLKNNFRILSDFTLVGSGTTIIEGVVQVTNGITIPVGHKIIIKSGGILYSAANLTVNGTLDVEGGGEIRMGNARTISVASGAALNLLGSAGNPAVVSSLNASSRFTFNVAGAIRSNYAVLRRTAATGMNVTGTIFQLDNTDFRAMIANGYGLTLGAAAIVPATLNTIGFYNDDAVINPKNINANAYNLTAITLNTTSGDVSGSAYELDPRAKINWGAAAATKLSISNDAETNEPTATLAVNTSVTFAEFAFTLTQADTATNITQVILTMTGSAAMSDLTDVKVYKDVNFNCDYDAVTDTQIGSNLVFTGSPLRATVTINPGDLTTNSPAQQACLIVRATSALAPVDQRTVSFSILSSSDVTNSESYALSDVSGTPISSGTSVLINNTYSNWVGGTSTAWNTATNWSPATLPSATRDCQIGTGIRTTLVNANPVRCGNATLQTNGTLDFNNTTNILEITNSITVSSGFNFANSAAAGITMKGTVNQSMGFQTAFPGNVIINNTGGTSSRTISLATNSTINGNLTCTAGILSIPNGLTLTVLGAVTIQTGCTVAIEAGGTLAMGNSRTLTVDLGGTLQMIGSPGSKATLTSNSGTAAYEVIVNGSIKARYYVFDHLGINGVSIEAGATIDPTYYLQDGTFTYPVSSSSTLLKLKKQIPGNTLENMIFASNGSAASTITNINSTGASAGTLTVASFSGDFAGESFDTDPAYVVNWTGLLNTITISQEATSPTPVTTGVTYNMGRFGFQQVSAGVAYSDTDITTLSLSLTGTGSASDVSAVRLYSNSTCSGSGGSLIGTGTFTGSPSKVTFTIAAGALVVPAAVVTTTKVCVYVEFDISLTATNGNTVGLKINSSSDFVNSLSYSISTGTTLPITLGTASTINTPAVTTWTGATSTDWSVASNWSAGVPTPTINCSIPNVALDPIISSGTGECKDLVITNGVLVINAGAFLDVYGDLTKTAGTLTTTGTFSIKDGGINKNHLLFSNSAISNLTLAKTGTGTVTINKSSMTITTLTFSSATTTLTIPNGNKLVLPNNVTISMGTLNIQGGGALEMANGRVITVSGGTFRISGTSDSFPQNIATKGVVSVTNSGANTFGFTATSGTVDLTGFQFDRLNVNGLNIGGTTTLSNLSGGQFTNLSTTYANVKAIQINTSGSIPVAATNIAWVWGNFNSFTPANAGTPTSASAYKLVSSTGCANNSIDFTGWTGDWYESQPTFNVSTKVTAANCTINLGASSSAVSLLSLVAVPFDNTVDVRWRTNSERNHLGFNVYRTDLFSAQFQQINKGLIRNLKNSGSNQVSYRFIDKDVNNNQIYYYYIEDVDVSGKKVLHGPVSATPLAGLGAAPADNPGENSDTNSNDGDDGGTTSPSPIPNPSYENLGNGVVILSKTSKSIRIKITPALPVFTASAWNNSFEDVSISGYSKTTTTGSPELPEKDILIEVQSFAETVNITNAKISESVLNGHLISPVPNYSLNGAGVLIPDFEVDSTRYSNPAFYPSSYYSLQTNLVKINKSKFLKLKINPLKQNPVTRALNSASEIILDIGLNGDDWNVNAPDVHTQLGPYSVTNALRINYKKSGVYQISYDDFINSEVDGAFKNSDLSLWRLYNRENEIPMEIYTANGNFGSADYIRFYVTFNPELESETNQLILSPVGLDSTSGAAKRMELLNSNPQDQSSSNEVLTRFTKLYEQNLKYIDGITLEDGLDHYFYADLVSVAGFNTLNTVVSLPEIDINNAENVTVKYHVRGKPGVFGFPVKHHVSLHIAGIKEGEEIFEENSRQILTFEIPADRFIVGNNTLSFKVEGSFAPATDYDYVLVDKIEISYNGFKYGSTGASTFSLIDSLRSHSISNFTSAQILGYDITVPLNPKILTGMSILSPDGGASYNAQFFVDGIVDDNNLKHFYFLTAETTLKPSGLSLNPGSDHSLKNSSNRADLIVYGEEKLIQALDGLIERRKSQGLEVMTITPAQVYGEFSYGIQSSLALKDFMNVAINNWEKAPRFLLILGDASVDPKDYNVGNLPANQRSILEKGTMPAPLIPGRFIDYSSDNFYVTNKHSHRPLLAVGRLPTNNPALIEVYAEKVKNYEDGVSAPVQFLKKITFIADEDTGSYENFNQLSKSMMSSVNSFETVLYDRTELGSKAVTKNRIINEFNQTPFLISMMGHGAFDRFGDDIFNVADVQSLSNPSLPVVVNWNCEGAYFYDANKTYKSMGEELIFNSNGGAIIYLGSTTQTTPPAQAKLANVFFSQLSSTIKKADSSNQRFGEVLFEAKVGVGLGAYEKDVVNSFSIIGDPSLRMPSELFPPKTAIEIVPIKAKKQFFGCNANASDGSHSPWHEGVLELVLYISLMIFGARFKVKRSKN